MANFAAKFGLSALAVLVAVIYQLELHRIVSLGLGIGKTIEPVSAFPYQCRRIRGPGLHACEDMWLSESTRQLFLACSDPLSRKHWMPNVAHFNVSGRGLNDSIIVMDIDAPHGDGFKHRVLRAPKFFGTNGDGRLHLVGLTGVDEGSNSILLLVVNAKPSVVVVTGAFLDQSKHGGNSTIELFRTGSKATELRHVKTFADTQIATPNNVAAVDGSSAFYFTNDHGLAKAGLKHTAAMFVGIGDVSFCDDSGCKEVASGFKFPNGLTKGRDGLIYVPSAAVGGITVFQPQPDNSLQKLDHIDIDYAIDNLAVDANGDIFAAAVPKVVQLMAGFEDPYNSFPPSTVLRIHKTQNGYEWTKILEDAKGEVLPAATTVIHDAKTDRLFLSGVFSPFITVCDKI